MDGHSNWHDSRLIDARVDLESTGIEIPHLDPDSTLLAYADPEFLLRDETRGIRMQLELLKPDLEQRSAGIDNTVVVFGSARFVSPEVAQSRLVEAQQLGDADAVVRAERDVTNAAYYEQARVLGALVSHWSVGQPDSRRLYICTGGGPGIMEAANRGAWEAGVPSVGLSIALPFEEEPNRYVTPNLNFTFHYFALRKMHFMLRAKALVAFPGGFGTLDELFEVVTLVQTRKSMPVPIVLFGTEHWRRLIDFDYLVEAGLVSPGDLDLFHFTDDPDDAWSMIRGFYRL